MTRRCDDHVGQPWPPRCARCDDLAMMPRVDFRPGTECALHPHYVIPCARCERDAEQAGGRP